MSGFPEADGAAARMPSTATQSAPCHRLQRRTHGDHSQCISPGVHRPRGPRHELCGNRSQSRIGLTGLGPERLDAVPDRGHDEVAVLTGRNISYSPLSCLRLRCDGAEGRSPQQPAVRQDDVRLRPTIEQYVGASCVPGVVVMTAHHRAAAVVPRASRRTFAAPTGSADTTHSRLTRDVDSNYSPRRSERCAGNVIPGPWQVGDGRPTSRSSCSKSILPTGSGRLVSRQFRRFLRHRSSQAHAGSRRRAA